MKGRYRQTLINKNFRFLFYSRTISRFGDGIHEIAMILLVYNLTGSAAMVGIVVISSMLPNILFLPFGGVFADRLDRKKIMILCDLGRALTVLLIPLLYWTVGIEVWVICVIAFVTSMFESFFVPCEFACVPDLVGLPNVQSASALFSMAGRMIGFIGLGIGGAIVGFIGPGVALCVDSATFFLSALFISFLPKLLPHKKEERKFFHELLDGLKFVRGNGLILSTLVLCAVANFAFAPIIILLPVYNAEVIHQPDAVYGYLMAIYSLGMALGFLRAGDKDIRGKNVLINGGLMVTALFFLFPAAGLPSPANLVCAIAALLIGGFFCGMLNVPIMTILQKTPPSEYRGRVGSVVNVVLLSMMPISLGIAGPLIDRIGPLSMLAISLALMLSVMPYNIKSELYRYDEKEMEL